VSLGPDATLKRGYAIARDADGRPVGSAADARRQTTLTIQFRDGDVPVKNLTYEKGEGQ